MKPVGLNLNLSSLTPRQGPDSSVLYDVVVIGSGPAALSAAVYLARKKLKTAILGEEPGGQVSWTSVVENYLGFATISGPDLSGRFRRHVESLGISVGQGLVVEHIERQKHGFLISGKDGTRYRGKAVVFAAGKSYRCLNVPGEDRLTGRGVAFCATCDAPLYKDKQVFIVGGGNSAFTAAFDLLKYTSDLSMVNFVRGWTADEILADSVRKPGTVRFYDYHEVVRIIGEERVEGIELRDRATGRVTTFKADGVFVQIGLRPNSDAVSRLVKLSPSGEVPVDAACCTDVPGFFAAGDVTDVPFKQIIVAAGEGAKAALSAYSWLSGQPSNY